MSYPFLKLFEPPERKPIQQQPFNHHSSILHTLKIFLFSPKFPRVLGAGARVGAGMLRRGGAA